MPQCRKCNNKLDKRMRENKLEIIYRCPQCGAFNCVPEWEEENEDMP